MSMLTTSHSSSELVSLSFQEGMAARRSTATDLKDGERRRARTGAGEWEQGRERAASGSMVGKLPWFVPTGPHGLTAVNGRAVSARGQVA